MTVQKNLTRLKEDAERITKRTVEVEADNVVKRKANGTKSMYGLLLLFVSLVFLFGALYQGAKGMLSLGFIASTVAG